MCFSANIERHFFKIKQSWVPFLPGFSGIFVNSKHLGRACIRAFYTTGVADRKYIMYAIHVTLEIWW